MRNLFKSSFFSFLRTKGAMIILSVIAFITATAYTLLSSTGNSFESSYNEVVQSGNLHDFTSKEKYDLSGNMAFKEDGSRTQQEVTSADQTTGAFSKDLKYIYFPAGSLNKSLEFLGDLSGDSPVIRIASSQLNIQDTDDDGVMDKIDLQKGEIRFDIAFSKTHIDKKDPILFWGGKPAYDFTVINPFAARAGDAFLRSSSLITSKGVTMEDQAKVWSKVDELKFDKSTVPGKKIVQGGSNADTINAKVSLADFENNIIDVFKTHSYFNRQIRTTANIVIDKDPKKTTGIYQKLITQPTNATPEELKKFQTTEKAMQDEMDFLGFSKPRVVVSSVKGEVDSLKADEAKMEDFMKQFAFDEARNDYFKLIDQLYSKVLDHKLTESVAISDKSQNFKVVNTIDNNQGINKLHVYEGYNLPTPSTKAQLREYLAKAVAATGADIDNPKTHQMPFPASMGTTGTDTKPLLSYNGFKYSAQWNELVRAKSGLLGWLANAMSGGSGVNHEIPGAATVMDPSSYFAYVSPSYYSAHNLQAIDPEVLYKDKITINGKEMTVKDALSLNPQEVLTNPKYSKYILHVGLSPFIVIGSAIQPDFAFPIIDAKNPIPNSDNQAVIFTSANGYKRAEDSYRNNDHENYLSFKFKDNVQGNTKGMMDSTGHVYPNGMTERQIMDDIETISRSAMSWPSNIRIVSGAMDTSENVILAQQRISFLTTLKKSISTISWVTTTALILAAAFISMIVIKKQINSQRKNMGILLANGYTKNQVAWSTTSIALIIAVIPTLLGYITGHFLQFAFIDIFDNYWTLPIHQVSFSWITMLVTVVLPVIGIITLAYCVTLWEMRGSIPAILAGAGSKTSGWITSRAMILFRWVGIKTKISISIFTSNISKMILIIISATLTIVVASTGLTMAGKFGYASTTSKAKVNYDFNVRLVAPTAEGGLLRRISPEETGADWTKSVGQVYKDDFKPNKPEEKLSKFHLPSPTDETASTLKVNYLDNKIETEALLNQFIGASGVGTIPWLTVQAMIPEGQAIVSKEATENFFTWAITDKDLKNQFGNNNWFKVLEKQPTHVPPTTGSSKGIFSDANGLIDTYRSFLTSAFHRIFNDFDNLREHLPFLITYRNVILDHSDETYTNINGEFNKADLSGKKQLESINVMGVKPDTTKINFNDGNRELLRNFASKDYGKDSNGNKIIPVIANTYFEKVFDQSVGSTFSMETTNSKNRFINITDQANPIHEYLTYKVIATTESYDGVKIYTSQDVANTALGYNSMLAKEKVDDKAAGASDAQVASDEAFNAVLSSEESPTLFKELSLYSVSGYYPGTGTITNGDWAYNLISNALTRDKATYPNKYITSRLSATYNPMTDFLRVYSKSPYVMTWSNVDWAKMDEYSFDSTLKLSSDIILMIEIISIILSILFIAIITIMLISDNKKFIATMKVMGYRSREISVTFFKVFIPAILVAMVIALPIIFGMLEAIQAAIVGFGDILIPTSMLGWEIPVAMVIIFGLTILIYSTSVRELRNTNMLNAFKE